MKKITKIMSVLLMAIVVAVTAAACSSGSIVGKTFELNADASDMGGEQMPAFFGVMNWTIEFKSSDTCIMKMNASGLASLLGADSSYSSAEQECTYKLDGDSITFVGADNNEMKMKLENGTLVMEEDGAKLVFTAIEDDAKLIFTTIEDAAQTVSDNVNELKSDNERQAAYTALQDMAQTISNDVNTSICAIIASGVPLPSTVECITGTKTEEGILITVGDKTSTADGKTDIGKNNLIGSSIEEKTAQKAAKMLDEDMPVGSAFRAKIRRGAVEGVIYTESEATVPIVPTDDNPVYKVKNFDGYELDGKEVGVSGLYRTGTEKPD